MTATTDILPFATGGGANVISQATYAGLTSLLANGFSAGIAQSDQLNKVWRQSAFIAAGIANFCVAQNVSVPDDGNLTNLVTEIEDALSNFIATQVVLNSLTSPIIGSATGLKASQAAAGTSLTFTADQVIVASALSSGATLLSLPSYSETVNLATTGAGGMDTGAAPANGYVAIYAIGKTDGTKNILACNVTTSSSLIYGGANMPAGYTLSALIGIWPTNGSNQFPIGVQTGHKVSFAGINVLNVTSGSTATSYTSVGLSSAIPPAAKTVSGFMGGNGGTQDCCIAVASDANGTGEQIALMSDTTAPTLEGFTNGSVFNDLALITAQTLYYKNSESTVGARINVTSYTF